jgi:hypothetical protein
MRKQQFSEGRSFSSKFFYTCKIVLPNSSREFTWCRSLSVISSDSNRMMAIFKAITATFTVRLSRSSRAKNWPPWASQKIIWIGGGVRIHLLKIQQRHHLPGLLVPVRTCTGSWRPPSNAPTQRNAVDTTHAGPCQVRRGKDHNNMTIETNRKGRKFPSPSQSRFQTPNIT